MVMSDRDNIGLIFNSIDRIWTYGRRDIQESEVDE